MYYDSTKILRYNISWFQKYVINSISCSINSNCSQVWQSTIHLYIDMQLATINAQVQ